MSKRQVKQLLPLPANLDPTKFRCVTFFIPDYPDWYISFWGWLYEMTYGNLWHRDDAHTGVIVAAVWEKVILEGRDNFFKRLCEQKLGTAGADTELMIRQDPDNPCLLQSSIDGVNWCTFADLSKCLGNPPQPGNGIPQPPAGGGTQCYHAQMQASGKFYVPTVVSTGDVIELQVPVGAGNDGSSIDWWCPDGTQFFAGVCINGTGATNGSDPLNTVKHMRLIYNINGTFYDAMAGPFTIPSSISNAPVFVQVNDSNIADDAGSYTFDVCVTNNAAATWCLERDFELSPGPWTISDRGGGLVVSNWIAGIGFPDNTVTAFGDVFMAAGCELALASSTITLLDMTFDLVPGHNDSAGNPGVIIDFTGLPNAATIAWNAEVSANDQHLIFTGSVAGVTLIRLFCGASNVTGGPADSGSCRIKHVRICGTGTPPSI